MAFAKRNIENSLDDHEDRGWRHPLVDRVDSSEGPVCTGCHQAPQVFCFVANGLVFCQNCCHVFVNENKWLKCQLSSRDNEKIITVCQERKNVSNEDCDRGLIGETWSQIRKEIVAMKTTLLSSFNVLESNVAMKLTNLQRELEHKYERPCSESKLRNFDQNIKDVGLDENMIEDDLKINEAQDAKFDSSISHEFADLKSTLNNIGYAITSIANDDSDWSSTFKNDTQKKTDMKNRIDSKIASVDPSEKKTLDIKKLTPNEIIEPQVADEKVDSRYDYTISKSTGIKRIDQELQIDQKNAEFTQRDSGYSESSDLARDADSVRLGDDSRAEFTRINTDKEIVGHLKKDVCVGGADKKTELAPKLETSHINGKIHSTGTVDTVDANKSIPKEPSTSWYREDEEPSDLVNWNLVAEADKLRGDAHALINEFDPMMKSYSSVGDDLEMSKLVTKFNWSASMEEIAKLGFHSISSEASTTHSSEPGTAKSLRAVAPDGGGDATASEIFIVPNETKKNKNKQKKRVQQELAKAFDESLINFSPASTCDSDVMAAFSSLSHAVSGGNYNNAGVIEKCGLSELALVLPKTRKKKKSKNSKLEKKIAGEVSVCVGPYPVEMKKIATCAGLDKSSGLTQSGFDQESSKTHRQETTGIDRKQEIVQQYKDTPSAKMSTNGTLVWEISDFRERINKNCADKLSSPPFYSNATGYKMRLRLCFYESEIGVFIEFLIGQFDHLIPSVFHHRRTFCVLDQRDAINNRRHVTMSQEPRFGTNDAEYWMTTMWGFRSFASNALLLETKSDYVYLRGDTVLISVVVEPLSILARNNFSNDGVLFWSIDNYRRTKWESLEKIQETVRSECFYSASNGYRMQAYLYFKGGHMKLWLCFLTGEYDQTLNGNFSHKTIFEIVDQSYPRGDGANLFHEIIFDWRGDKQEKQLENPMCSAGCDYATYRLKDFERPPYLVDDILLIKVAVKPKTKTKSN